MEHSTHKALPAPQLPESLDSESTPLFLKGQPLKFRSPVTLLLPELKAGFPRPLFIEQ